MSSSLLFQQLTETCRHTPPATVLVLGSGLSPIARRVQCKMRVPFSDLPGLPSASTQGHNGCLTLGDWAGQRVLVYEGRLHYYEGHSWDTVAQPLRLAVALGVKNAVLTNAAGGIADELEPGSLMALRAHLLCNRPRWWQVSEEHSSSYSPQLRNALQSAAATLDTQLAHGVYAAVTGPCYETPAEIRAYQAWGADAVGMSTAWEIETAHTLGLKCLAISLITNRAAGLSNAPLHHQEVLAIAAATAQRLGDLLEESLKNSCFS